MAVTEPQVQAAFDATDGVIPPSAARAALVHALTPLFNGGDPSSDHNLLSGLQGGAAGDYQHLTTAQVSAFAAKEPSLGNPSVSGRILSSTTAGVRSWVAPYALPTASASILGGAKVGTGLAIASGVLSVAYGSSAGTACQGNDSRLSDARTPTAHTHPASDISGLTGWATKAFTNGSTSDVAEGSNLYFTPGRVLPVNLTGFAVGINESINSSMTILAAFGAAQGQINARLTTVTADTASRAANTVYAAPNGSAGTATFRSLVPADIPNLDAAKLTSGTLGYSRGGTGISAPGATAGNLRWSGSAFAIDAASYALSSAIPAASSTTPAALGAAAVGTGTTWARADHVHAMPTAAQVGAASSSHNHTLDSLSNVTISSNSAGELLRWNGTAWVNATLAEAGIQPAGSYLTGNQTITLSGIVTGSGATAITTSIADAALSIAKTNGLQAALDARMSTALYPDLVAIEALAGTSGFLKKTSANTWSLDTSAYLTTTGTAAAATKLATARTLTIGATGKAFDGTSNVAWTLAEIGAAPSGHNHALDSLSNVTIFSNSPGEILKWTGTSWVNNTLSEAGIQPSLGYTPVNKAGDSEIGSLALADGNRLAAAANVQPSAAANTNYLQAPVVAERVAASGATYAAGVGFHNRGVNAALLFYDPITSLFCYNRNTAGPILTLWDSGNLTNLNQLVNGPGYIVASDVTEIYNWYSSRPADCNLAPNGNGGIRSFKATSSMTANKPPQGDSHIIHLGWDNTSGYETQLSVKPETGAIQMRGQNAGVWSAWRTVWDSVNLTNLNQLTNGPGYVTAAHNHDSAYLGISATAAAATKLATARTLTIGGTGKAFDGTANVSWSLAEIGAQAVLGYTPVNKGGDTMAGDLSMPYNYSYRANDSLGRATTLIGDNQINLRLNNSSTVGWFARIRSSSVLGYTLTVDCPDNASYGGICNLQVTGAVQAQSVAVTGNIACAVVSVTGSDIYTLPASDPVGTIRFINGSVASADNPKIIAPSGSYLRYTLPDGSYHNDATAVSIWRRHIMVQKTATDVWWVIGTLA